MDRADSTDSATLEKAAQALEVSSNVRATTAVLLGLAALVYGYLSGAVPEGALRLWLAICVGFNAIRFASAGWVMRQSEIRPAFVLRLAVVSVAISGVIWGYLPWIAGNLEVTDPRLAFTLMVLTGIAGGSLAGGYAYAPVAIVFTVVLVSLLAAAIVQFGVPQLPAVLGCILTFVFLMSRTAIRSERSFLRYVRLAAEQRALTRSLEAANAEVQASNRALAHLVHHDALTGHLNRAGFRRALEARLVAARSRPGARVTLLLADLDGFKAVNDSFGHPAGDAALVETDRRIAHAVAGLDADIARMGGDEFAVILSDPANALDADAVAAAIIAAVAEPYCVNGERADLGCSIGIAAFPDDGGDLDSLVNHADMALYAAKEGGRGRARCFDVALLSEGHLRRVIEADLPVAIERQQVEVLCQPQVSLVDGSLKGVVTRLHWHHPLLGPVPVTTIMATADRLKLQPAIARLLVEEAMRLHARLALGGTGIRVAIAPSANGLPSLGLSGIVADVAGEDAAAALEVQISGEAAFDLSASQPELDRLKALGVRLCLDNFGAGQTRLSLLDGSSVTRINIANRYSHMALGEREGLPAIKAIVALARAIGVEMVATGVDDAATAERMAALGCEIGQGTCFAGPMTADDMACWIAQRDPGDTGERRVA